MNFTAEFSAGETPQAFSVLEPENTYEMIINICISVLMYSGACFETLCFILFIHQMFKKVQYYCTAYFYVLIIGYFVDVFAIMSNVYTIFKKDESVFSMIANFTNWYSGLFLGPWNTLLAVNRFTALLFWNKHSKIWSGHPFWFLITLALLYPFLANGYTFQDPFCFFNRQIPDCHESQRYYTKFEMISNGVHVCLSATLGVITALSRRLKLIEISADKRKFETHLLIQSFFSSILFGFYCLLGIFVDIVIDHKDEFNITDTVLLDSFQTIASCYTIYFHISSTILLFCLSKTVRDNFIQFYDLRRIFKFDYYSKTGCGLRKTHRSWFKKNSRRSTVTVF